MMNHQRRARTADPAPEAVARQHALSQSAEESLGTIAPIVTRAAAAERLQLDQPPPA
jgi:hypothetical protein